MSKSGDCECNSVNKPPDTANGAEIFRMRCATCHTTEEVSFIHCCGGYQLHKN